MHLAQALKAAEPSLSLIQYTKSACSPIFNLAPNNLDLPTGSSQSCITFNFGVVRLLRAFPTIRYAVLSSPFTIATSSVVDQSGRLLSSEDLEPALSRFRTTVAILRSAGVRAVVISSPPSTDANVTDCQVRRKMLGTKGACHLSKREFGHEFRSSSRFLDKAEAFVPVIRVENYLCDRSQCQINAGPAMLYNDGHHLSAEGSHWLGANVPLMQIVRDRADSHRYRTD